MPREAGGVVSILAPGKHTLILAAIVGLLLAATVSSGSGVVAAPTCDKYAAPVGLDSNPGTEALPFRTARRLAGASSPPARTGCLRAGTYAGNVNFTRAGEAGAPVTLQSYPGERAVILGRVWVQPGADHLTLSDLDLVGVNPQNLGSPLIEANDVTVESSDITNDQTADCVFVGSAEHAVERVTIARNRIHDCGERPNTNRHQGISVWNAADTTIARNVIYDNADRGIQLYPFAQRTSVIFNRIDGNGEGVLISGNAFGASNDNVVERNVVTNSTMRDNLETFWRDGAPVGTGNVFRDNCVFGGVRDNGDGGITPRMEGAIVEGGLIADPGYVDREAKDFRFRPDSACLHLIRQGSGPPPEPDPNLVFDEEFDGALLDLSTWHTCFWWSTITCTIGSNDELELYNPADVFVQGGALRMRAQRRNLLGWDGNLYPYTSGMAMTGGASTKSARLHLHLRVCRGAREGAERQRAVARVLVAAGKLRVAARDRRPRSSG